MKPPMTVYVNPSNGKHYRRGMTIEATNSTRDVVYMRQLFGRGDTKIVFESELKRWQEVPATEDDIAFYAQRTNP